MLSYTCLLYRPNSFQTGGTVKKRENRPKRHRVHASYYEYVSNVVDKCSHKWLILDRKDFRAYRFETQSNVNAKIPGGKLIKITPAKCKSYSCPICGKKKVLDLVARLKTVDLAKYRFFTLTLKNQKTLVNTEQNLERVSKCFNKLNLALRKRPEFKGLEYFRVTEIGKDGMVHVHGIVNKYIPSKLLSELWLKITKDSYITKIERIKNKKDAVQYLYKYLTKDVSSKNKDLDAAFFNSDKKNSAAMFYELNKRRFCASRKFFPEKKEKNSEWLPYWFEAETEKTVETTLESLKRQYNLTLENIDLEYYYGSEQFIYELFINPNNQKAPPPAVF